MERRDIPFAEKDAGLRDDVRRLGALVGDVLREQAGEALYDRVEAARVDAIGRREGEAGAEEALRERVRDLPAGEAEELVHAFGAYFEVVNLAETVHRVRRRRDYARAGAAPQPGSLADAVQRLADAGLSLDDVRALFDGLLVEPVFTAHPTQATRRTLLEKQQRIGRQLLQRLDASLTPGEDRAALDRIRVEVTSGWQTEQHPGVRKTVHDELEQLLFYVVDVLYPVVAAFYDELDHALAEVYGGTGADWQPPALIRFASWVGADMDGNPNVDAGTISDTLAEHRRQLLSLYLSELDELYRQLSQSRSRVAVSAAVMERAGHYADLLPQARERLPARHESMPYRVLLWLISARLHATLAEGPEAYSGPRDLLDDLETIAASLREHGGEHAGLASVQRLIRRVRTFGFHLLTLDVRQDAQVHARAVGRLLGDEQWLQRDPDERAAALREALAEDAAPRSEEDDEARSTLDVFRAMADGRERYGHDAVGAYIISMAKGVDDVLAVLLLARWAGLRDDDGNAALDIAPLFETVDDLEHGPAVMAELLADPVYADHLRMRGGRQIVMVGYSDSNKDGGLAASRWAVQRCQEELVRIVDDAGVGLTIFHGRGGTVGRGGGNTDRGVAAAPSGSVRGRLRTTEQGEIVAEKYGLRPIALRTLEQTVSAVALASAGPEQSRTPDPGHRAIMDTVAAHGRSAYHALVRDDPRFLEYFRQATPIDVIERMQIGSRPPSRRSGTGMANLRAIPWVFAWNQCRLLLPGWYGLGTGLAAAAAEHGEQALAAAARDWPFLRNLLADAEMVLAKSDIEIAAQYAALVAPPNDAVFDILRAEHRRTVEMVLHLKGGGGLLDDDPTLQRSIRLRNPYLDPMNLLQVDLLARWRAADRADEGLFQALLATVNGVAQGLRNTG